jgi:hypothetical protein
MPAMARNAQTRVSFDGVNLIAPSDASRLPRYGTLDESTRMFGPSLRTWCDLIGERHVRAIKLGGRTLIDFLSVVAYFESLPAAQVKAPSGGRKQVNQPSDA